VVAVWICASVVIGVIANYYSNQPIPTPNPSPPTPHPWTLMMESVFLWENGEEQFVAGENSDLSNYLLQTLHRVNLQARCIFSEEKIQEIKKSDKVLELRFRFPRNVTISQWVEPQDRDHIKTDENGYRILENVYNALFVLEDHLNGSLQGHVLVSTNEGWSCWAIQQGGELDKSWVEETGKYLLAQ